MICSKVKKMSRLEKLKKVVTRLLLPCLIHIWLDCNVNCDLSLFVADTHADHLPPALFAALSVKDVRSCMMDPQQDSDNPLLKKEQDAQVCIISRRLLTFL